MATLVKSSELSENNKEFTIRCAFPNCRSRIIPSSKLPNMLTTIKNPPTTLRLSKSSADVSGGASKEKQFYEINDVWDFDNIGVSRKIPEDNGDVVIGEKTVSIQRLLVCSDCDRGPVGFAGFIKGDEEQNTESLIYFLDIDSVLYEVK